MKRSLTIPLAALAGLVLLAGSTLGSYAANGGPLLLGKGNSATKTTTLKSGKGSALSLKTKGGAPPLKVNSDGLVKRLNADRVDGKDGEALETTSYSYALTVTGAGVTSTKFTFPGLPDGRYLVSFNVAADGGGGAAFFCYFYPDGDGGDGVSRVPGIGDFLGGVWHATGTGELDMAIADTYAMYCETSGGSGMTVPANDDQSAQVVFTRIDNLVTASRAGGPL